MTQPAARSARETAARPAQDEAPDPWRGRPPGPGRVWLLRIGPFALLGLALGVWHLASLAYPPFILPGPAPVAGRLWAEWIDGTLSYHAAATIAEALPGLLIGSLAALALGYPIAKSELADRVLSPFIVASQGIPFIAIAPLLLIWFGNGPTAKILLCAVVVFFPITVNIVAGVRGIPALWREEFRILNATPWQTFARLELPAALPLIFAGLRVGASLAMIGAIAAEFLGTDRGLGFLINQGRGLYDTTLVLVGIVATMLTALAAYGGVRLLERLLLAGRYG